MTEQTARGQSLDNFESEHLIGSIMDGVIRTPQEHRRTLASFRTGLVLAAAVVLVAGGVIAGPRLMALGTAGGGTLLTYHADGLQFDYPGDWKLTSGSRSFGPDAHIVAFVGTGQGAAPCFTPDPNGGRLCALFSPTLAPNQVVIEIAVDDSAPWQPTQWLNPPTAAWNILIGGQPATTGPSVMVPHKWGADVATCWVLTSPQDSNRHYVLTAAMRGPDTATLKAQVDALLASVQFDAPG